MQLRHRDVEGAIVVDLSGDGIGSEPSLLRQLIVSLLDQGHRSFVLNLEHLQKMDSTCLAEIAASYRVTIAAGGDMTIACANPQIRRVLRLTKVDTCVNTYESEVDAVSSFDPTQNRAHT
jgi:anti-sigma B factor antagonist